MATMKNTITLGMTICTLVGLSACGSESGGSSAAEVKTASNKTPIENNTEDNAPPRNPDAGLTNEEIVRSQIQWLHESDLGESTDQSVDAISEPTTPQSGKKNVTSGEQFIVAEPASIDLGEIPTGDTKRGKLRLVNTGTETMVINTVKASCGCTAVNFIPNTELAGGESTEIDVQMKAGTRPGPISGKRLTVVVEGQPNLTVPLNGTAVTFVKADPPTLNPYETEESQVTLKSVDGKPFRVVNMSPPVITEFDPEAKPEHTLTLNWEDFREVGPTYNATFHLDHPQCSRVTVATSFTREEIKNRVRINEDGPEFVAAEKARQGDKPLISPPAPVALAELIKQGKNEDVLKRIAEGANINERDRNGLTLLAAAAKHGNDVMVRELLDAGADIDVQDSSGRTPLMLAAQSKNVASVQALVDAGASVTVRDNIGQTALSWASGIGNAEMVRELIDAGSDVEIVGSVTGWTPIIWASGFGDPNSIEPLIEAGANIEAADHLQGATPLIHAARTGKLESLHTLLRNGADLENKDRDGLTALLTAAANSGGTADKLKALIDAGADITVTDNQGNNALDLAKKRTDAGAADVIAILKPLLGDSE